MTYVIVTGKDAVSGLPARTYQTAFNQARRLYGGDVDVWMKLNLRIEENRKTGA